MSILKKNIKYLYYLAYSTYILAFLLLFIFNGHLGIYLFAFIFWLWFGLFWCAVHTQELVNIEDKNRDLYSSIISSWKNVINIIVPLLIAGLFFIVEKYFYFSAYIVLFLILPFVYAISFLFIKNIWDYTPSKIRKVDVKNFFNLKKYLFGQLYFLSAWFYQWLSWCITPIIAITLLKTEINVWLFEWIIGLVSTFLIIFLSSKRKIENRIKIMWIISLLIFINLTIFVFNFSLFWYIVFTLIALILNPLYRVSEHVFDLKLMDTIKYKWSDFFPAMIFREVSLWIWRIWIIIFLSFLVSSWFETELVLKIWLFLTWVFIILSWVSIYLHMKFENREEIN